MKTYLPLVFLVVFTFVTSVNSRAIHRSRRSATYYANETACVVDDVAYYNGDPVPSSNPCEECKCRTPGFVCTITECEDKDGCQRIKVPGVCCSYECGKDEDQEKPIPQEDAKEVPVSTTFIPVSISSDVKEEKPDVPHIKGDEEPKKESSQLEDIKPTPEVVVVTEQPDKTSDLEHKDKPEVRQESDEQGVKSEPITPVAITDPLKERESSLAEVIPQATKEPESPPTRQEPDDSDKKLEVVTETRKEGRSGTNEPQFETTSPPSVELTSKLPQEPEKISEDKPEQDIQKPIEKDEPVVHHSEGTTSVSSQEEKQEPARERPEVEKLQTTTAPPLELKSSEEKEKREEESTMKHFPATEVSVEVKKSESEESTAVAVPTTPQSDKQEGREDSTEVSDETKEDGDKDLKQKEQDVTSKSDESSEVPVTTASSESPIEEAEKEVTSPPKSGPNKRFADWLDYVPRDFQV